MGLINQVKRKYKNLFYLIIGTTLALFFSQNDCFKDFLLNLGRLGYLGGLLAGVLYALTFTAPIGVVILIELSKNLFTPLLVVFAVIGAVSIDLTVFRLVRSKVAAEVSPILKRWKKKHHWRHLAKTRYFGWTLPFFGAIIIALPISDELGVSLLGLSKISTIRFLTISILSHLVAISLLITLGNLG